MFTFNALIPELSVSDFERSLNFYLNILPFRIEYERKECKFAMLSYFGSQIMIEQRNGCWETGELSYPFGRGINLQIAISGINEVYANILKQHYPVRMEIQKNCYQTGDKLIHQKEFLVMDPDGYLLRFAQQVGEMEF